MARGISIKDVENKVQNISDNNVLPISTGADVPEVVTVGVLKEHVNKDVETALGGKQDVINDLAAIRSGAELGATALQSYTESDPTVSSWAKQSSKPSYTAVEVGALPNNTKYGYSLDLSLDNTTYILTIALKDQDGTVLSSKNVDFPVESVVVNGRYDSVSKKIILTLQNGTTTDIPVGDLIAGLQTEITSLNMLSADFVDDTNSTHKFVTEQEKQNWNNAVRVTYAELVALKNASQLVEGTHYRITDYVTTTTQASTRSAGHQFDVIVLAVSVNSLNENAHVALHEGDTYFANSNLSGWEIKYDINNDTTKYNWADATNGKGVIYWMKDEKGNECPYDFKNIQFMVGAKTNAGTVAGVYYFTYSAVSGSGDSTVTDLSMYSGCTNNKIDVYLSGTKRMLNANVFRNTSQSVQCNNMNFGPNCFNNTFGNFASKITMRGYCANNEFGSYNSNFQFGDGCSYNTFGGYGSNNTFGNSCSNNVIGNYGNNNNFGNACSYNTFGQNCIFVQFGNQCTYNTFGNYTQYIAFGNYCNHIKFGNSGTTKNYYRYVIAESGNQYIYLDCAETTSASKYCQNVQICLGANNTTTYRSIVISTAGNTFRSVYDRDYYTKPSTGIPASDIASGVIPTVPTNLSSFTDDLGSSPTHTHSQYLTSETEPDFNGSAAATITSADITAWNGKSTFSGSYNDLTDKPTLFSGAYADLTGKPNLATVATSGDYDDLSNKPTIPSAVTESTVSGWGFTKNAGTITGITMNGASKGTSGVVDLGTVITEHQSLTNYVQKSQTSGLLKNDGTVDTNTYLTTETEPAYTLSAAATLTSSNIVKGASQSYIIWSGTLAEYDAITTKDNNTIYFIKES